MYKYETHMHTYPVSACAKASVSENLEFYKQMGYDGVFLTNHFVDGNINVTSTMPYSEKLEFYFSDYEKAVETGRQMGIKVFLGIEMTYKGTDFLVYGLDKEWFLNNPQIMDMGQREKLSYIRQNGGFVVHAHPYREAGYIDHIRLYPQNVDGVEVINANRTELENKMAELYAENYGFLKTAGTDNHIGKKQRTFAGVMSKAPINSVNDYIYMLKNNLLEIFTFDIEKG